MSDGPVLDALLARAAGVDGDEERWALIREAWTTYRKQGAGAFDWDYDSRDLMDALVTPRSPCG